MKLIKKEILTLNLSLIRFPIVLEINFMEMENSFILESKKMNIEMDSTTKNIDEAKQEFSQIMIALIEFWIKKDILINVLDYYGFEENKLSKIKKDKFNESKMFELRQKTDEKINFSHTNVQEIFAKWEKECLSVNNF